MNGSTQGVGVRWRDASEAAAVRQCGLQREAPRHAAFESRIGAWTARSPRSFSAGFQVYAVAGLFFLVAAAGQQCAAQPVIVTDSGLIQYLEDGYYIVNGTNVYNRGVYVGYGYYGGPPYGVPIGVENLAFLPSSVQTSGAQSLTSANYAVGAGYLVTFENSQLRIQSRSDKQDQQVQSLPKWWATAGEFADISRSVVLFDRAQQRWTVVASASEPASKDTTVLLVAVSRTSDPKGAWAKFKLPVEATGAVRIEKPAVKLDQHWLIITFKPAGENGGRSAATRTIAIKKEKLYSGEVDYLRIDPKQ